MKKEISLLFVSALLIISSSCEKKQCGTCYITGVYYCMANGVVQTSYTSDSATNVTQCQQLYGGTIVTQTLPSQDHYCFYPEEEPNLYCNGTFVYSK